MLGFMIRRVKIDSKGVKLILRRNNSIVCASVRKKNNKKESGRKRCKQAKGEANESKAHQLYPYFHNIPDELTVHILLQLPIKSLLICKSVCKNWKILISEPHFAKLHFERAPSCFMIGVREDHNGRRLALTKLYHVESDSEKFKNGSNDHVKIEPVLKLPDAKSLINKNGKSDNGGNERLEFDILNSCNGLLCLCDTFNRYLLLIYNPITREFIRLPEARTNNIVASGFGFDPKTNEYKVIRIKCGNKTFDDDNVSNPILEIHTVGTRSWKKVEMDPQISISGDLRYPTCINGALHWIKFDSGQRSILCFNFESERLQSFPSPPRTFLSIDVTMGESRGFLYICDRPSINTNSVTMWFMKKYGIGESWTNVYNIDVSVEHMGLSKSLDLYGCSCWPIKHFEDGVTVFLHHRVSNWFIYFEPEKYGSKKFRIHGISHLKYVEILSYIPSLISLKDIVKGDNIEVLNINSTSKYGEENEVLSFA